MNIQQIFNLIVESTQQNFTGAGVILVTRKGKTLVLKKPNNNWGLPGGKPNELETPKETALRETEEETGVKIKNLSSEPLKLSYNNKIYFSYIYIIDEKTEISLSKEHKDFQWVYFEDLKHKKLIPPFKDNLRLIISKIKKHLAK
jgi:8-oxo-dGTP pyrophosphatase MutT (NUDIX family)